MVFSKFYKQLCVLLMSLMVTSTAMAEELRLLAWNVYMLPPPIIFSKQKERTRLQVSALQSLVEENDVLVLSEAFQSRYKRVLLKELKEFYPHYKIQKRRGGLFQLKFMSSGIMIMSKFPMKVLGQTYFDECTISDCFASKGALLVEITLSTGKRVQILGTHMQAGAGEKMVSVRSSQVEQLRQLMDEFMEPGVPQILAGDLNIDSRLEGEFEKMVTTLSLEPQAEHLKMLNTLAEKNDCFGKSHHGNEENLDHILIRTNESGTALFEEKLYPIRGFFSSKAECDLSDHHPVQSLIRFNSRVPSSLKKRSFQSPLLMPDYSRAF